MSDQPEILVTREVKLRYADLLDRYGEHAFAAWIRANA